MEPAIINGNFAESCQHSRKNISKKPDDGITIRRCIFVNRAGKQQSFALAERTACRRGSNTVAEDLNCFDAVSLELFSFLFGDRNYAVCRTRKRNLVLE